MDATALPNAGPHWIAIVTGLAAHVTAVLAIWYWGIDGSNCLVATFLPEVAVGPLGFLFQVTILVMMVALAAFIGTVVTQAATHIAEPARQEG